jgi:hypothetical protein
MQQAPRYTAVYVLTAGGLAAIVTTVADRFWARTFAGGSLPRVTAIERTWTPLQELLSEAGLPADSGWTAYQPSGS